MDVTSILPFCSQGTPVNYSVFHQCNLQQTELNVHFFPYFSLLPIS